MQKRTKADATIAAANEQQNDLLRRLKDAHIKRRNYTGLSDCDAHHCGRAQCIDACFFGALRRRRTEMKAISGLIRRSGGPVYEVRVSRGSWIRPSGHLDEVSIAAAKQLNRRTLFSLYKADIVAVGRFKVYPAPKYDHPRWFCEIHEIIIGAEKQELEDAFCKAHFDAEGIVWVQEDRKSVV
jgi:hypothetical protein